MIELDGNRPALDPAFAPGDAVLTKGYQLPAKYILHTVGPRWVDGAHGEAETLSACYRSCLALAKAHRLSSIAFPIIAAGSFGYPKAEALEIAVREIRRFLNEQEMTVYLVVFNRECYEISAERHARVQSFIDQHYVDAHTPPSNLRPSFDAVSSVLPSSGADMASDAPGEADWAYDAEDSYGAADACFAPDAAGAPPAGSARPRVPKAPKHPTPSFSAKQSSAPRPASASLRPGDALDEGFTQMLLRKIDERGMTDAECYKRANIDRKLFSKIRKDPHYRPSKATAVAFAVALRLDLAETRELLMKAGFALSRSYRFDLIIECSIRDGVYDIDKINETLFDFDQPLLGA